MRSITKKKFNGKKKKSIGNTRLIYKSNIKMKNIGVGRDRMRPINGMLEKCFKGVKFLLMTEERGSSECF